MLIKWLFVALLVYLACRAIWNLVRVIVADRGDPSALKSPDHEETLRSRAGPRFGATRNDSKADVEDARWVDVE